MKPLSKLEERIASALGCAIMGVLVGGIGFGKWGALILGILGAWIGYTEELR